MFLWVHLSKGCAPVFIFKNNIVFSWSALQFPAFFSFFPSPVWGLKVLKGQFWVTSVTTVPKFEDPRDCCCSLWRDTTHMRRLMKECAILWVGQLLLLSASSTLFFSPSSQTKLFSSLRHTCATPGEFVREHRGVLSKSASWCGHERRCGAAAHLFPMSSSKHRSGTHSLSAQSGGGWTMVQRGGVHGGGPGRSAPAMFFWPRQCPAVSSDSDQRNRLFDVFTSSPLVQLLLGSAQEIRQITTVVSGLL